VKELELISVEVLRALVQGGESEILEFKATTGERKEGTKTLCAMLNHHGGRVVYGVLPDGIIAGQQTGLGTLEGISNEAQLIDPPTFPSIEQVEVCDGKFAIVVSTERGQNRPYFYKGKAYRRVANTTLEMRRPESDRLMLERLHGESRWENQPAKGWTTADLDCELLAEVVNEIIRRGRAEDPETRDPLHLLRGLGLAREGVILRAGVLLFGKSKKLEQELPQCLLKVAVFKGIDRSEFLDNRQFHGNLFELMEHADRFLRSSLPVSSRIQSDLFERSDNPLYPPSAIREAVVNAFCHRDYSIGGGSVAIGVYDDKLEVTSSGSLHFGLTTEALFAPHESHPWNPLIARVLYRRGYIEAWGRGTLKMMESMQEAGLPKPEIEATEAHLSVRFRSDCYIPPQRVFMNLSELQRSILTCLQASPAGLSTREVEIRLNTVDPGEEGLVGDALKALKDLQLIETQGRGRGSIWFHLESRARE